MSFMKCVMSSLRQVCLASLTGLNPVMAVSCASICEDQTEYYFPMFLLPKLLAGSVILHFQLIKARSVLVHRTSIVDGKGRLPSLYTMMCVVIYIDFDKCPCQRGQL